MNKMKKGFIFLAVILFLFIAPNMVSSAKVDSQIFEKLNDEQEVSVIVMLKDRSISLKGLSTLGKPDKTILEQKKTMIKEQQDKVLFLSGLVLKKKGSLEKESNSMDIKSETEYDFELRHKYSIVNGFSGEVTRKGLEKLKKIPEIKGIYLNRKVHVFLNQSIPQINADNVWKLKLNNTNITGKDETICIIDTGIDYNHSSLGDGWGNKVIGGYRSLDDKTDVQECASNNSACFDDNSHGTHCAGIAASNDTTYRGVAPDAKLIAIKVLDNTGSGWNSDVIAGIDWCVNNASQFNISIISMSLGITGTAYNNTYCDDDYPSFASAIDSAFGAGILVAIASGNCKDVSCTAGISVPSCIENATPVGAVNNGDMIEYQRGYILNLLAPGISINSTIPNNDWGLKTGTSMSTPHVAGAAALIKQFVRLYNGTDITPQEIEDVFNSTGKEIDDMTNSGRNYSRIDVYAAILSLDTTPPNVTFVNITPENETITSNSFIFVNVTVNDSLNNISSCLLEWNHTSNESMTKVGNGTSVYCYKNKSIAGTGIFYYKAYANDSANNIGVSELRQINITNTAPNATNVTINSTDNLNRTNSTLVGSWDFYDTNSDSQVDNKTKWYNNSIEVTALANLTSVGSGNTTKNQNWTFSVRVFDGKEWSEWVNSTILIIENSAPTQPSLTNPENESIQTTVNVTINWSDSIDADDDSITYYIHFLNSSPPSYNSSTTNISKTFIDLTDNKTYYWYIIANDGTENSTSETRQFIIDTSIPSLNFEDPTPADGERLTDNYIYVNTTVTHSSLNISNCTLLWNNGTNSNISMERVGTGTSVFCFKNMATTDGINYTYSVIANTTDGVEGTTGNRTNLENTKPQLNLSYPGNNSNITTTSTYLNWSSSDSDNDVITYYVYGNSTRNSTLLSLYNGTGLNYSWTGIDDGTYYWYVVANDSYETNTSSEYKFNVDVFSIPSHSSGGGGGGSSVTYEQKSLGTLAGGSGKTVTFTKSATLAVTEITVTVKNAVTNAKIKVDAGSLPSGASVPSSAKGSVYKYITITKTSITDNDVSKGIIKFKVNKEWLTDKGYGKDTISLHRYYNSKWNKLETTRDSQDTIYYYYSSESPGFSTFAITAEKATTKTTETKTTIKEVLKEEKPKAEENVTTEEPKKEESPVEAPPEEAKSNTALIITLIAVIIVLVIVSHFVQEKEQKEKKKKHKTKRG